MSEIRNVHDVRCPFCGAAPGRRCRRQSGLLATRVHGGRLHALDAHRPAEMLWAEWELFTSERVRETDT